MNLNEKQMRTDIVDMLTDWFEQQAQDICCECNLNKAEEDIGYSSCPAEFDLFSCPNLLYELEEEFNRIADRLIEILPEPEDDDITLFQQI